MFIMALGTPLFSVIPPDLEDPYSWLLFHLQYVWLNPTVFVFGM